LSRDADPANWAAMNIALFYGIVFALGNIVLTLVGFFLGFQTDKMAQGRWFGFLSFVVMIVVLWIGIRAAREEAKDKSLSYGRGVGIGTLIALYGGIIGAIYGFIHFTFINPNFADYVVDAARQQWIAKGMSDSQMDTAEKFTRMFTKPAISTVMGIIVTPIIGAVISLVLAAFLKRKPVVDLEATPPAA
jgi:low temperature requirement protein LtrA